MTMKKVFLFVLICTVTFTSGCNNNNSAPESDADLVVYGKIYQANVTPGGGPDQISTIADAMVIKDGRYIYVGTADSAKTFETEKSQIIDCKDKGIIVPGMTEGHGHYILGNIQHAMGTLAFGDVAKYEQILEILDKHCAEMENGSKPKRNVFGFGFNYPTIKIKGFDVEHNIAADFDNIAHKHGLDDLLIFISDGDGHRCFVNSNCMRRAGILNEDGTIKEGADIVQGGEIFTFIKDGKKYPTGQFTEQANSLIRMLGMDFSEMLTPAVLTEGFEGMQRMLLSNGYTNTVCGLTNYFDPKSVYDVLRNNDEAGNLFVNVLATYNIETWMDYNKEIQNAIDIKNTQASKHVHPTTVKLFMDGVTETGTGLIFENYNDEKGNPTDDCGIQIWPEDVLCNIVSMANNNGMPVHTHTFGDKAVNLVLRAYSTCGKKEVRNSIVHARNIKDEDYAVIANNNVVVTEAVTLHLGPAKWVEKKYGKSVPILPDYYAQHAYPIKSLMQKGIVATSSTDYPATSGCPVHPFKIMETAVTGYLRDLGEWGEPFWTDECVTPEQMLQMLTINGAYQLGLEAERGSIEEGKYADFVIVDKDVLTCPHNEIGDANIIATYFEGKKVSE